MKTSEMIDVLQILISARINTFDKGQEPIEKPWEFFEQFLTAKFAATAGRAFKLISTDQGGFVIAHWGTSLLPKEYLFYFDANIKVAMWKPLGDPTHAEKPAILSSLPAALKKINRIRSADPHSAQCGLWLWWDPDLSLAQPIDEYRRMRDGHQFPGTIRR